MPGQKHERAFLAVLGLAQGMFDARHIEAGGKRGEAGGGLYRQSVSRQTGVECG